MIWLAWASMARRLRSRKPLTSTAVVIRSARTPKVSRNGRCSSGMSRPNVVGAIGERQHVVAVHRGHEHAWRAGRVGGAQPHAMDLDVVGVAVSAVLVVGGEDLGLLVVEDGRQSRRGLVDVGLPETPRGRRWWARRPYPSRGSRGTRGVPRRGPRRRRPVPRPVGPPGSRPGPRTPSGTSPSSPRVAVTSTTRWPSAAIRAIVPPVWIASSSGWAWKNTAVAITGAG